MTKFKKFIQRLGPGFITGASDDDPSGIATYSQTGAMFGYAQLWTALFSLPFMAVIQEMCGRIGLVTGKGLSSIIRHHFSKKFLFFTIALLLIANTINIGADLGAMASTLELFLPLPFNILLILITGLTLSLEIFVPYVQYTKYLKYFALSLFTYVFVVFIVKQDWEQIMISTLMPKVVLTKAYLMNIVAILGTTISPYLFFWQANEEVEEEVAQGKLTTMGQGVPRVTNKDIRFLRVDTVIGMFFSNVIMFFIMTSAASTLFVKGLFNIETATQAAQALKPLAGDGAYILFALGILGVGLLAVPVLAGSASYALSEALGWKEGLYRKFNQAHGFYGIIIVATILGLTINFFGVSPFSLLYYTAIINGVCAPILIFTVLKIANDQAIMGKHTNSKIVNIVGLFIGAVMALAAILLLATLL